MNYFIKIAVKLFMKMGENNMTDRKIVEEIIENEGRCSFLDSCSDCPLTKTGSYRGACTYNSETIARCNQWLKEHPENKSPRCAERQKIYSRSTINVNQRHAEAIS